MQRTRFKYYGILEKMNKHILKLFMDWVADIYRPMIDDINLDDLKSGDIWKISKVITIKDSNYRKGVKMTITFEESQMF